MFRSWLICWKRGGEEEKTGETMFFNFQKCRSLPAWPWKTSIRPCTSINSVPTSPHIVQSEDKAMLITALYFALENPRQPQKWWTCELMSHLLNVFNVGWKKILQLTESKSEILLFNYSARTESSSVNCHHTVHKKKKNSVTSWPGKSYSCIHLFPTRLL